jgi:hypothetical protein
MQVIFHLFDDNILLLLAVGYENKINVILVKFKHVSSNL